MRLERSLWAALAGLLLAAGSAAPNTVIALSSGNPGTLYSLDPATGAASLFRTLNTFSSSVDIDFLNGKLYTTDVWSGSAYSFGTLDLSTGAFTPLNNQMGNSWMGLAAVPKENRLYAVSYDSNNLISLTPGGTATVVGYGLPYLADLAYDAVHDILYGVSNSTLYTINRSAGTAAALASLGVAGGSFSLGLAYDGSAGVLYLNNGNTGRLYRLDPATGTATLLGDNGVAAVLDGLAVEPDTALAAGEADTALLFGTGLALVGSRRPLRR